MKPHFACLLAALLLIPAILAGCADRQPALNKTEINLGPVDCGYKWFQTGRSPDLAIDCALPRGEEVRSSQTVFAIAHAWELARDRCPASCPPRALKDTSVWEEPNPDGVCESGYVSYTAREFFQCGQSR